MAGADGAPVAVDVIRARVERQIALGRDVVVVEVGRRAARRARLHDQLAWWQQLRDPHLVEIVSAAAAGDVLTVMLDLADAAPVAALGTLPPEAVASVASAVLEGLVVVHGSSRAHGLVGLNSVFVDRVGVAKVGVPGLSPKSGETCAPELHDKRQQSASVAGDVFAVGATMRLLSSAKSDGVLPPIIERATSPRPNDRFGSAAEMLAALRDSADRSFGPAWLAVGTAALSASLIAKVAEVGATQVGHATTATLSSGVVNTGTSSALLWSVAAALLAAAAVGGGVYAANRSDDRNTDTTASATPTKAASQSDAANGADDSAPPPTTSSTSPVIVPAVAEAVAPLVDTAVLHGVGDGWDFTTTLTLDRTTVRPGDTVDGVISIRGSVILGVSIDEKALSAEQCAQFTGLSVGIPEALLDDGRGGQFSSQWQGGFGFVRPRLQEIRLAEDPAALQSTADDTSLPKVFTLSGEQDLDNPVFGACRGFVYPDSEDSATAVDADVAISVPYTLNIPTDTPPGTYAVVCPPDAFPPAPIRWADGVFNTIVVLPSSDTTLTGSGPIAETAATETATQPAADDEVVEPVIQGSITVQISS